MPDGHLEVHRRAQVLKHGLSCPSDQPRALQTCTRTRTPYNGRNGRDITAVFLRDGLLNGTDTVPYRPYRKTVLTVTVGGPSVLLCHTHPLGD